MDFRYVPKIRFLRVFDIVKSIMQKRVRCPLCGFLAWQSQIEKYHNIDVLAQNRVVRAKGRGGFKYNKSEDAGLVALVRAKIKALYNKYFEAVNPRVTLIPSARLKPRAFRIKPNLVVLSGVKLRE